MADWTELTKKEGWEQQVFRAFAARSGLKIDAASIRSCEPPSSDIGCVIDGSAYYFELGEVVPGKQAAALSTKGVYSYGIPDPEERGPAAMLRIMKKKQRKTYETNGAPVDLLLYFSKDLPLYMSDVTDEGDEPTAIDRAIEECRRLGPFTRIWTYCSWNDDVKRLA